MTDYSIMYSEFSDDRLIDLSKNILIALRKEILHPADRPEAVYKGMYATEELKNRGYGETVQDLIAEIGDKEGVFINV